MNSNTAQFRRQYFMRIWQAFAIAFLFTAAPSTATEIQSLSSIRSQAEEYVKSRIDLDPSDLEVRAEPLDVRLRLPKCSENTEAYIKGGQPLVSRVAVGIRCTNDAHRWAIFVPVTITRYAKVVVSGRRLPRGQPINKSDVKVERRAITHLNGRYLTQVNEVTGHLAKRSLEKGKILYPSLLKRQNLVKRGQNVIILAENPIIQVRSKGVALANGRAGEKIRVRNTSTKKIVEGTITSEGYVKILL